MKISELETYTGSMKPSDMQEGMYYLLVDRGHAQQYLTKVTRVSQVEVGFKFVVLNPDPLDVNILNSPVVNYPLTSGWLASCCTIVALSPAKAEALLHLCAPSVTSRWLV